MITGIGHLAFSVSDMEKSLKFYCDALGLKKAFSINDDENRPWIEYIKVSDGQFIELFYTNNETPQPLQSVGYNHLCLSVSDINEIAERMRKFKIHIDVAPRQGKDLNFQCWVKDPDGNRIEFMQISPDSPQSNS